MLNLCHTMGLLIHDKKSELIPTQKFLFLCIPVRPGFLPGHSNSGSISQNQSTDSLIHAQPRRMCSYVADPATQKNWFLWDGCTQRSPTLHLSTLGLQCFNQQLVDPSFSHGEGGSPMVDVSTQCSERSTNYPDRTRHSVVHGCIKHRLGTTLECIDGVQCMDNNQENTSHQRTRVRSHTQSHASLVAEANSPDSPGCTRQLHHSVLHQQAGHTWSIQLCRRTKKLLLMGQANQIVLRARHIPGRLNVLADILSRPSQMSGTIWSLHPSVF